MIDATTEKIVNWAHWIISKNSQKMMLVTIKSESYYIKYLKLNPIKSISYKYFRDDYIVSLKGARKYC